MSGAAASWIFPREPPSGCSLTRSPIAGRGRATPCLPRTGRSQLNAAAIDEITGAVGDACRRRAAPRPPPRPLRAPDVPGGDGECEGRPRPRCWRRPRRPSPDGRADAGAGDGRVLGAGPAPRPAGGPEVGRHDGVRRDGHRPAVRLRRAGLLDQRRADVSHRQRVRDRAARLRRPPLRHDGGGGRREPLREPLHRAQRDAPPLSARARAALSAVLLRPPGRARAGRREGVVGAVLRLRRRAAPRAILAGTHQEGLRADGERRSTWRPRTRCGARRRSWTIRGSGWSSRSSAASSST